MHYSSGMEITSGKWWLRKHDDGEVFGPVDLAKLKQWTHSAQVSPLDMVSNDGENWMRVPLLQELHMDYLIQVGEDSFYGPTTEQAIQEFLRRGEIGPQTTIINCCTGEEKPLGQCGLYQSQPAPEEIGQDEPGRRTIRLNLQQRVRELEVQLVEKGQKLSSAEVRIRQLERRLQDAGLGAD